MSKVIGLKQLLNKKYKLLNGLNDVWAQSFGLLEEVFVMLVWGESANGKSNFIMQFIKELSRFGKVLYVALEEGHCLTTQLKAKEHLSDDEIGKVQFADHTMDYEGLLLQLKKKKSAKFIVIDSLQYLNISYVDYKKMKQLFPRKSFIFISHSKGRLPDGKTAEKIRSDAGLKIRVEKFIAFTESRYGGNKNYVIWEDGAIKKYGKKLFNKHKNR